jgi:hypothetical protein
MGMGGASVGGYTGLSAAIVLAPIADFPGSKLAHNLHLLLDLGTTLLSVLARRLMLHRVPTDPALNVVGPLLSASISAVHLVLARPATGAGRWQRFEKHRLVSVTTLPLPASWISPHYLLGVGEDVNVAQIPRVHKDGY